MSRRLPLALPLAVALAATHAPAQAVPFVHPDGSTHWYDVVAVAGGITWDAAQVAAGKAGGALASITHTEENEFLFKLSRQRGVWQKDAASGLQAGPWLGGVQYPSGAEPAGGWAWASLESMAIQPWAVGQPDDEGGADRLRFGGTVAQPTATWDDAHRATRAPGYVVEFAGPRAPTTVGLLRDDPGHSTGYTLYNPLFSQVTLLVDDRGRTVRFWISHHQPGAAAYLLPNGRMLRAGNLLNPAFQGFGGGGGIVEEFDWGGGVAWSHTLSDSKQVQHHDFVRLPNGNTVMIVWEKITAAEAIAHGRDPKLMNRGELWPDKLVEVDRAGKVVWEWRAWDHLVQDFDRTKQDFGDVGKSPDRIDVNFGSFGAAADWMHSNALDYNPKLDQLLLSVRHFDEIWVLDHSTTTAEARTDKGGRSGKGGRLLYRWGNPRAYRAGTAADRKLFVQHDAHWIPEGMPGAGDILVFSNGTGRPGGDASVVEQITPPTPDASGNYPRPGAAWGPLNPTWRYPAQPTTSFFSQLTSGAQRLPNGNTLVCEGWNGHVSEVTPAGKVVWEYECVMNITRAMDQGDVPPEGNGGNAVFRAPRYLPDFPGLKGKDLTPAKPVEGVRDRLLVDGSTVPARVRPGGIVDLTVDNAARAGQTYLMFSSATPGLIPLDYRHVALGYDSLVVASALGQAPGVFVGYFGTFDALGMARARIAVPPLQLFVGVDLYTSFVVLQGGAPFGVPLVGNTVTTRIVR